MNKEADFAGTFYPEDADKLNELLDSYKQNINIDYRSKAVIVPHAGYVYSGHAAMAGFQYLEPSENIFIIAPSHHKSFNNIALPEYSFFETPLGNIEVNNRLIKEIAEKFPCTIDNEPFEKEHSIEVQLPFLQNLFYPRRQSAADFVKNLKKIGKKIKIIPVLTGNCDYRLVSDLIATYWENSSFVISSDLSHYYPHQMCRQIDTYTATIIETGRIEFLENAQACGIVGIKGLVDFANNNDCTMIRAEMYNSGDISGEMDKVVGYGSWFMYTDSRNEFIEKIQKKIKNIHFNITQEKENIEIKYFSDASTRQNFINELKSKRKLDIIKGFTTKGVHHDDFLIYLNDKQVNIYGSQGQHRTAMLSLKLSELQVIYDDIGEYPILLLDDFMSELDEKRRKNFLENIKNIQVIITCTDKIVLENLNYFLYNVVDGKIIEKEK